MISLERLPPDISRLRVVDTKTAAAFCNLSVSTFRRMLGHKQVPDAIRLSERRLGWRIGDLIDWGDARAAGLEWAQYLAGKAKNDNVKINTAHGGRAI